MSFTFTILVVSISSVNCNLRYCLDIMVSETLHTHLYYECNHIWNYRDPEQYTVNTRALDPAQIRWHQIQWHIAVGHCLCCCCKLISWVSWAGQEHWSVLWHCMCTNLPHCKTPSVHIRLVFSLLGLSSFRRLSVCCLRLFDVPLVLCW